MDLEEPVLVLLEDEGERLERLVGAEPGELAAPPVESRSEVLRQRGAHEGVDAVRREDEIGVAHFVERLDLALELQLHSELAAAPLQDEQQLLPAEGGEPVAARDHLLAAEVGLDVAPVLEALGDLGVALGVGGLEILERLVREDDPPTEGVVGTIALDDADRHLGKLPLHEDPEIQAGWTAAETVDLHARDSSHGARRERSSAMRRRFNGRSLARIRRNGT